MAVIETPRTEHITEIERISGEEILLRCTCGVVDTYWASTEREESVIVDLHLLALL